MVWTVWQQQEAARKVDEIITTRADPGVVVHLLLFPPPPPTSGTHTQEWHEADATGQVWLSSREWCISGQANVITSSALLNGLVAQGPQIDTTVEPQVPGNCWYDRRMDRLAHAPYTPCILQVAAGICARAIHRAVFRTLPKVIALDCDNTLWGGAVAEVGPQGVALSPHFLALQQFFLEMHDNGVLLALCSRNSNPDDVLQVWRERADEMVLQLDHIVAHQISWDAKSCGLHTLATSLCLGIDTVVLVDDSSAECAEVSANRPEVGIVQLPRDPTLYPEFLKACWLFDPGFGASAGGTAVDKERTKLYRQVAERAEARTDFGGGLPAWVASLNITITFVPLSESNLKRAAQLTERTSQMNACKLPISAAQLAARCSIGCPSGPATSAERKTSATAACAFVRDRFGDHGIVGMVVISDDAKPNDPGILSVETFLLSCRSLHLGVEHAMMRHLATIANMRGAEHIHIQWSPSERNDAACHFFSGIAGASFVANPDSSSSSPAAVVSDASGEPPTYDGGGNKSTDDVDAINQAADGYDPEKYKRENFMTPELEGLSKKKLKAELRRRVREAHKKDQSVMEANRRARAAKRAASKAGRAPRLAEISQHRPFGNKPSPGYVRVPTASALKLNVRVNNENPPSSSATRATMSGGQAANARHASGSGGGRPVALHHETTLAIALGLTTKKRELAEYVSAAYYTPVERMLTAPHTGTEVDTSAGRDADSHGKPLTIQQYQEYYILREQARDKVKLMIQRSNPEQYAHVNHETLSDVQRMQRRTGAAKKGDH